MTYVINQKQTKLFRTIQCLEKRLILNEKYKAKKRFLDNKLNLGIW